MKRLSLSFVVLALPTGSTAARGQKGLLYLPDDERVKKEYSKDRYGF